MTSQNGGRPPGEQAILDAAAHAFARHGFTQASLQGIADAAAYSKAGLLHHFGSKTALYDAVVARSHLEMERIHEKVWALPRGVARDRETVQLLVDLAIVRPGLVALLLSTVTADEDEVPTELGELALLLFRAFDALEADVQRRLRVTGALATLGVLALQARHFDETSAWRDPIVAITLDTLGHGDATTGRIIGD